jgi:hypothetical protein
MSLINDALKRARQAQKENPAPPPALPFRPAETSRSRNSGLSLPMIVGLVVVVALAGLLAALAWQKRAPALPVAAARQPGASPSPASTPSRTATSAGSVPAEPTASVPAPPEPAPAAESPAPSNTGPGPGVPPAAPGSTNSSAAADAATNGTVVAADLTPPKPAPPKLQGIFYRPGRPSAVINGKNVFIGSRVGEFQVLAITQESVTIGSATQTNVLSLE